MRAAASVLGVAEVEVLDFSDSGMSGTPPPGSLCAAPLADLVRSVRGAIARHRPSVVVTPAGDDGHRDHQRVRDAVLAAADPALPVYVSCLPRTLAHEWLRHQAEGGRGSSYANLPEIGTPDEEVTTVIDTRPHYAARLAAISQHRSQASPFDGLPEDLRQRFLATEHLRRVRPPWPGGPAEVDLRGLGRPADVTGDGRPGRPDSSPLPLSPHARWNAT